MDPTFWRQLVLMDCSTAGPSLITWLVDPMPCFLWDDGPMPMEFINMVHHDGDGNVTLNGNMSMTIADFLLETTNEEEEDEIEEIEVEEAEDESSLIGEEDQGVANYDFTVSRAQEAADAGLAMADGGM